MRLNCNHYDTCFPDYFGGHHAPYLQIPVWPGMGMKDIKQSLIDELNQDAIGGSLDWSGLTSERLHKAMRAAINRLRPAVKGTRRFFTDLPEPDGGDCETVYAYFVFLDDSGRFDAIDWLGGE